MYALIKPLLFKLDSERAHAMALSLLQYMPSALFQEPSANPLDVMGLPFSHRIGLAAGFDKSGAYIDALAKLGFAFIEVGTVTPKAQAGNPKPRLFRLPKAQGLINRMGFNNPGVEVLVENLRRTRYQGIIGINIGKGKETPLNQAVGDYVHCLQKVYRYASYVTINISSPNTPELRQLQGHEYFEHLISTLRLEQLRLADKFGDYVPLVVKVSPDETEEDLKRMAEVMLTQQVDGIIATNTTCARDMLSNEPYVHEVGGLSGRPLRKRATRSLDLLKQVVGDKIALIGAGGVDGVEAVRDKISSGASLVQVYTGLIYQGPGLISALSRG